jgi:hypothetical protein
VRAEELQPAKPGAPTSMASSLPRNVGRALTCTKLERGDPRRPSPDCAARHDHVHVRMMRHRRSPGVQHRGDADAGAEMLGVGRDRHHRLGGRPEQQIVDHRLVLMGDIAD